MAALLVLLVVPVLAGLVVGIALGGRLDGLVHGLDRPWVLWLAAAVQLGGTLLGLRPEPVVFGLVAIWMLGNLRRAAPAPRAGLLLTSAGLVANLVPLALNGRMPYSVTAATAAGLTPGLETARNAAAGPGTVLGWLGDVIPVPPLAMVVSAGDLAVAAGIVLLVAGLMTAEGGDTG